jgi:imidazolonepropionase
MWDLLLLDARAATMDAGVKTPFGLLEDAALGVAGGRLVFVGTRDELGAAPEPLAREVRSLGGALVTPGLIDCHTHLVFGGNRAQEWQLRLQGASYEDIARAGGGILSSVRATRAASEDELVASARRRLLSLTRQGVTTVEIKSGYGLEVDTELRMLRAAGRLAEEGSARVVRTLLGAHALPDEFRVNREGYVRLVCEEMIPAVAAEGLAEAVDVFCEKVAFAPAETREIFEVARRHGLRVKIHAEQLSDQGGAALAASFGALSADHLEYLSGEGVSALAYSGTVAVLLPGAFYFLRETQLPPIAALRAAGVPIAIASDCNPGTSPVLSPLMVLNMACTLYRLTPEEALCGCTLNAARALGREAELGSLEVGKRADLAVWQVGDPAELAYWLGADLLVERYLDGRLA